MALLKYLIAQGRDFCGHIVCSFTCLAGSVWIALSKFSTEPQLHIISMSQQQGRTRPIPLSPHAPCDKLTVSDSGWGCIDFLWDNHVIKVLWVESTAVLKCKTAFQSEKHLMKKKKKKRCIWAASSFHLPVVWVGSKVWQWRSGFLILLLCFLDSQ